MMDETQEKERVPSRRSQVRRRRRRLIWLALVLLLAVVLVPPFINLSRFKSRITQAIAVSLGRPVQLSSVELRLVPWPSFVLTNLTVAEDPAYGAEPVLHADTVRADLSLWSLWQRRIEFGSIHVEDASLNLVRAGPGRWNFDSLFRTAAAHPGSALRAGHLPYLEATDSRINIKEGAEKLPFSLINTDLSFWQESSGDWRLRLQGQPARTDVALELADTGIVRLEASLRRASELRNMPVHLDLDWRDAQLGALARLLTGSGTGWRGALTGEAHVDGTPDAAHVNLRLRASGVHRAEFAPPSPLDFDANCGFLYDYARRTLSKVNCDSPLGDGHLQLTGEVPGAGAPDLSLDLQQIPAGAGLDLLRTMRTGIDPSLEAAGTVSGTLQYAAPAETASPGQTTPRRAGRPRAAPPAKARLSGKITVHGFSLSGGGLSQPLRARHVVFEPGAGGAPGFEHALVATAAVDGGSPSPLNVSLRLGSAGYLMTLRGPLSLARARELAQTAGFAEGAALNSFTGGSALLNLNAEGPWVDEGEFTAGPPPAEEAGGGPTADSLDGTVTLRGVDWRPGFLANHVDISTAVLHVGEGNLEWDPVEFSYGPVKGSAAVTVPVDCPAPAVPAPGATAQDCAPRFDLKFASLRATELQSAFLGARRRGTLLDSLIDRFRSNAPPPWPPIEGSLKINSLVLGPVTLHGAAARVKIALQTAELTEVRGSVLGGELDGRGTVSWAGDGDEPSYKIEGRLERVAAAAAGRLLDAHWSGGAINLAGELNLSGFKGANLRRSASGTVHFVWKHGNIAAAPVPKAAAPVANEAAPGAKAEADGAPAAQTGKRFEEWSGEVRIADGVATLEKSQMLIAGRRQTVDGEVALTDSPKLRLVSTKPAAPTAAAPTAAAH